MTENELFHKAATMVFNGEKMNKLHRFGYQNRYVQKGQILFTGSSLMEHFPIEELRLSLGLDPIMYNRGIGGFTTDEFLNGIHEMLLDLEPSKVFINIGTNDISSRFGEEWLQHLIQNYEKILVKATEALPECTFYVMAYYPANIEVINRNEGAKKVFSLRTPENIDRANAAVKQMALSLGCTYVDANEGLYDEKGQLKETYTTDGVHMICDAYVQVLNNLNPYIYE